ncbi:MAG: hypothetical protein ACYSUZ_07590 [Planctomycetota bacterium]
MTGPCRKLELTVGRRNRRWWANMTGPCRKLELTTLRYLSAPFSALKTAISR